MWQRLDTSVGHGSTDRPRHRAAWKPTSTATRRRRARRRRQPLAVALRRPVPPRDRRRRRRATSTGLRMERARLLLERTFLTRQGGDGATSGSTTPAISAATSAATTASPPTGLRERSWAAGPLVRQWNRPMNARTGPRTPAATRSAAYRGSRGRRVPASTHDNPSPAATVKETNLMMKRLSPSRDDVLTALTAARSPPPRSRATDAGPVGADRRHRQRRHVHRRLPAPALRHAGRRASSRSAC